MRLDYSEFSFGYAFTENLIRSSATTPGAAPFFPNLKAEGKLGFDVRIDLPAVPLYFQFKLPALMIRNTAVEISKHNLQGIDTPFFRMPLMTRKQSDQHQLLIDLEAVHSNLVFYATPNCGCRNTFDAAYANVSVHLQSSPFSPTEIGELPDDRPHFVAYRPRLNFAWFCSEPSEIPVWTHDGVCDRINRTFQDPPIGSVRETAESVVGDLFRFAPSVIRNNRDVIRQRVAERVESIPEVRDLSEDTVEVVNNLLVARNVSAVAYGLELAIAQPSA